LFSKPCLVCKDFGILKGLFDGWWCILEWCDSDDEVTGTKTLVAVTVFCCGGERNSNSSTDIMNFQNELLRYEWFFSTHMVVNLTHYIKPNIHLLYTCIWLTGLIMGKSWVCQCECFYSSIISQGRQGLLCCAVRLQIIQFKEQHNSNHTLWTYICIPFLFSSEQSVHSKCFSLKYQEI